MCELPMWLLAILFNRQGSSQPDGALMLAVSRVRSVSFMSREKSAAEPSLTWERRWLSSETQADVRPPDVLTAGSLTGDCPSRWVPTYDFGGERAARDVVVVVFDQDVVVSGQSGQVADAARSVLVVHTTDLCFGWTLDGQVQTPWTDRQKDKINQFERKTILFSDF